MAQAGCATYRWFHPTATQEEFRRDAYACERDARQSGYFGTGLVGAMNMQDFAERCMNARGYERRREN